MILYIALAVMAFAVLVLAAHVYVVHKHNKEIYELALRLVKVAEATDAFLDLICNSGDQIVLQASHPEYGEMLANRLNDMANSIQDATGNPRRNVCAETGSRLKKPEDTDD